MSESLSLSRIDGQPLPRGDMSDSQSVTTGKFYRCIAEAYDPEPYRFTSMFYGTHFDGSIPTDRLIELLTDEQRFDTFDNISKLFSKTDDLASMFPEVFQSGVGNAYKETITKLLWSTATVAVHGELEPREVESRNGGKIAIRGFTTASTIDILDRFSNAIETITEAGENPTASISRVNESGAFGMYRIGDDQRVLATARLVPRLNFDNAIEHGSSVRGAEASIGFTVDLGSALTSVFKKELVDPFCIRVDNEGDKLSLDVGSILGKPGTLGKDIADLITVGDSERVEEWYQGETPKTLNHNSSYFNHEQAELAFFAQAVGSVAAEYQNRWQASRTQELERLQRQACRLVS